MARSIELTVKKQRKKIKELEQAIRDKDSLIRAYVERIKGLQKTHV